MTGNVSKRTRLALGAAAAGLTVVVLLGCWFGGEEKQTAGGSGSGNDSAENRQSGPGAAGGWLGTPFVGWSKPAAVFVLTGQQHGYLEPCGCSERQSGGMGRRADLIRQISEEKGWPVTAFDVGGTLYRPRVSRLQSKLKFDAILKGLNTLDYPVLELGLEEMLLGPEKLYESHLNSEASDGFDLQMLGANVTLLSTKEIGTPLNYRIVEVGEVRVAVTGVLGESARQQLEATGVLMNPDLARVESAESVLPSMLEKMKAESPDLLVLLSHGDVDESKELASKFPEFHLVVTAGGAEDPPREPTWIGKTMLVQVGKKGKNAAVVGYFPDSKEKQLQLELLELDMDRFKNAPSMNQLMRDYQASLEANWPQLVEDSTIPDKAARFVGVEHCKDCHTHAYNVWSKTKHAHATESLVKGREGQQANWVSRMHDPECLSCHSTGWEPQDALRYKSGFVDLQSTPHLTGNQCENCHGPGSIHAELEYAYKEDGKLTAELQAAREALRLRKDLAERNVCIRCHDQENSPTFVFEERWPKVNHSGKKD